MADGLANNVSLSFPPGGPKVPVGVTFTLAPPNLPAEVSLMLARVLDRVPWTDRFQISNRVLFVMLSSCGGHYLSPELVKGRSIVTFSETLYMMGSEDYAAEVLLPQIALVVLQARHACEPPMEMKVGTWLDPKTAKVTNQRQFQEAVKEYRNAGVDLQIDVHFAQKKAHELAEQWNDAWKAAHPSEQEPLAGPGETAFGDEGTRPLEPLDFFGLGYGVGRKAATTEQMLARLTEVVNGEATLLLTDAQYQAMLGPLGEEKVAEMIAAARDRRRMEPQAALSILSELRD